MLVDESSERMKEAVIAWMRDIDRKQGTQISTDDQITELFTCATADHIFVLLQVQEWMKENARFYAQEYSYLDLECDLVNLIRKCIKDMDVIKVSVAEDQAWM